MNEFDKYIKENLKKSDFKISDDLKEQIEKTLLDLPEKSDKNHKHKIIYKRAAIAASIVFAFLILFPNISTVYANALEKIPVISSIVKVVTIRNYFYSDSYHEMDIDVPKIESGSSDAANYINKNVEELTKMLVDRFYTDLDEIGEEGHSSVYVDYDVVTDTDTWFTLKIRVHEAAGSSNTYYKYYHIDKTSGKIIKLADLAKNDEFYTITKNEIKRQMRAEMKTDENKIYWVDDPVFGVDFAEIGPDHNFYFNDSGDIVIVFDKYEVAPGFMGTPEFAVNMSVIRDVINPEYRSIINN